MTDNNDFTLTNENSDKWTSTQFLEKDPTQTEELCKICLWVNWRNKIVTVETVINDNLTPGELYYGICSRYELPWNTDFKEFFEFYENEIQPLLLDIGYTYEERWDGSNWYGYKDESEGEDDYSVSRIEEKLKLAPKHDLECYFGLYDLFGDYNTCEDGVIDSLEEEGIDLATANLDDENVMNEIVDIVRGDNEYDTYVLLMSNEEVEDCIVKLQKEIRG